MQFVIHIKNEYDYMYECQSRKEIFNAIKYCFFQLVGMNVPIFGVPDNLKDYHTSKKDIIVGCQILPESHFRLKAEDIYKSENRIQTPRIPIKPMKPSSRNPSSNSSDNKGFFSPKRPRPSSTTRSSGGSTQISTPLSGIRPQSILSPRGFKSKELLVKMTPRNKEKVDLRDFKVKHLIGKGSFGKVFLVVNEKDGQAYAMKVIRKDTMLSTDMVQSTLLEKEILQDGNHPFLVSMHHVFQTPQRVFFIMNFIRGGQLYFHLKKAQQFSESQAKFYVAQIAMGLGHLHKKCIIYRDLKPENVMLGEDGYLQLADFGLAKNLEQNEKAFTFCGTPQYLAPEIILEKGHTIMVDWWCLGIITYEMIVGFTPFIGGDSNQVYESIKKKPVYFPDPKKHDVQMSLECKDFIRTLLVKDPKKRLGKTAGVHQIMNHPWLQNINTQDLLKKKIKAQYLPKLSANKLDISNFDKNITQKQANHTIIPDQIQQKVKSKNYKFSGFNDDN